MKSNLNGVKRRQKGNNKQRHVSRKRHGGMKSESGSEMAKKIGENKAA